VTNRVFKQLMQQGVLWRGSDVALKDHQIEKSDWEEFDSCLGGGLPRASLVEIFSNNYQGISLLLPMLARLSQKSNWLTFINPPYLPFAPGLSSSGIDLKKILLIHNTELSQGLWAAEQALKSSVCSVVLMWPKKLRVVQIRRLQLAAEKGDCIGILFRPMHDLKFSSPSALRIKFLFTPLGFNVEVLKQRASWKKKSCNINYI